MGFIGLRVYIQGLSIFVRVAKRQTALQEQARVEEGV